MGAARACLRFRRQEIVLHCARENGEVVEVNTLQIRREREEGALERDVRTAAGGLGMGRALDIILTGRMVQADEALAMIEAEAEWLPAWRAGFL